MKKWMGYALKGLAIFGGLVVAAMIMRSSKQAKATGVKFTQALENDVKSTTSFGA